MWKEHATICAAAMSIVSKVQFIWQDTFWKEHAAHDGCQPEEPNHAIEYKGSTISLSRENKLVTVWLL